MPHYKDKTNAVHFLDSSEFEHLLPVGSVQITEAEAEALNPRPAPVNPRIGEILKQLAALDQRKIRPLAEGDAAFLATLNSQTAALRVELAAL